MATKFDAVAGSELRDTQGEILDVKGADISELEAGRGIINDNHSNKLPDVLGRITSAKKIFSLEDCDTDRQKYYWNKIKAAYIYTEGLLYDDEDHRSAKAAAAILKHQFRTDSPLKLKCSVEGGILERGKKDQRVLARTKIRGLALTFAPANNATLVEGLDLAKSAATTVEELDLIKSYAPYAVIDAPTLVDFSQKLSVAKIRENVEKINEIVGGLKKNISLVEPLEKAPKKQLLQQLGSDPKAAEVADWLANDVKRDDVQQWFLKNYKKDPSIYNDKNKHAVRHYVGTAGIHTDQDIGKVRFDKSHSFDDGMKMWSDAEEKLKSQARGSSSLIKPDEKTKKLIDLGNGWGWYDLGKGYDAAEGRAMSHCGNVNAEGAESNPKSLYHKDRILSLRKEHNINGETYHEPRLSFIENEGHLGETKGFGNSKPAAKYHDAIIELLKHPRIKENIGGGYAPNNNFYLNDLPKDKLDKLLKNKPNLEKLWKLSSGKVDSSSYPKKHKDDAKLHNQALIDLNNGKENTHQTRFRDIDPKYAKDLISKYIKSGGKDTGRSEDYDEVPPETLAIMQSPHLDKSHIDEAFDQPITDGEPGVLSDLLSSHAANKEHISKALGHESAVVRIAAAQSPHFKPEHMDRALKDESAGVRQAATKSPHFKPEHMERALKDKDTMVRCYAVKSPHFKPEHMDDVLKDKDESVRKAAVESPHFKPEHMDDALKDKEWEVSTAAIASPHFKPEHMDRTLKNIDPMVRQAAAASPHFKPEHMDDAMKDEDSMVLYAAVKSPHFKPEHMDKALSNWDYSVRKAAVESPHFKPEHMKRALKDVDPMIREAAVKSLHFKPEHMDDAMKDEDESVRKAVIESPHFKPEHMDWALKDVDPWVRETATKSPHFKPEHMKRALGDEDPLVREAATNSPHYQTYLKQKGLTKALTAGYGGADAPMSRTGGSVLQTEAMDSGHTFRYIDCPSCGKDQPYLKYQVKCRNCGKSFPFDTLAKFFISK